jgi:hypothetical protein
MGNGAKGRERAGKGNDKEDGQGGKKRGRARVSVHDRPSVSVSIVSAFLLLFFVRQCCSV